MSGGGGWSDWLFVCFFMGGTALCYLILNSNVLYAKLKSTQKV